MARNKTYKKLATLALAIMLAVSCNGAQVRSHATGRPVIHQAAA